jgi:hypothetical protein
MAKNRKARAGAHPYEIGYWAKKFKTTPAMLMEAVDAVGSSTKKLASNMGIGAKKKRRKKRKAKSKLLAKAKRKVKRRTKR